MPDPSPIVDLTLAPAVTAFFDAPTNTASYVVRDPASRACAVIDSVMDIDYAAGRITYEAADKIIAFITQNGLTLDWLIETHVHADHLSGAPYIQGKLGGKIGISANITISQVTFGKIFNEGTAFQRDGSQFDALFDDGDQYMVGTMPVTTLLTPGHTPALVAMRYNPDLKAKYQALRAAGKPAKVTLTVLMRKLIVMANELVKADRLWTPKRP